MDFSEHRYLLKSNILAFHSDVIGMDYVEKIQIVVNDLSDAEQVHEYDYHR